MGSFDDILYNKHIAGHLDLGCGFLPDTALPVTVRGKIK